MNYFFVYNIQSNGAKTYIIQPCRVGDNDGQSDLSNTQFSMMTYNDNIHILLVLHYAMNTLSQIVNLLKNLREIFPFLGIMKCRKA